MVWSQIKLTSYDFSDLHMTGEFDNCPGTGRIKINQWNIYVNAICTSAKTRRFSPVAVLLITHRPVPGPASSGARTGIGRFDSIWRLSDIVRCPDGHRRSRTLWILNKNRLVPVRCVQTPARCRPGTVTCPADVILPSMTLPNALRMQWDFK